jgi:hypothetical protein
MMEPITKLEKSALITTGAAAAFKTLLWSLEATIDSTDPWIAGLRVTFAVLSFVAFDLVIVAVVMRGWSRSGAATVAVAAVVSALIALDVAKVWPDPALHAAPAVTLATFAVHLMLSRRTPAAVLAAEAALAAADQDARAAVAALESELSAARAALAAAPSAQATAAVQVNGAPTAALPRTIPQFIAARAAEQPGTSAAQLAAELGTSADTVRRMLERAQATEVIEQEG